MTREGHVLHYTTRPGLVRQPLQSMLPQNKEPPLRCSQVQKSLQGKLRRGTGVFRIPSFLGDNAVWPVGVFGAFFFEHKRACSGAQKLLLRESKIAPKKYDVEQRPRIEHAAPTRSLACWRHTLTYARTTLRNKDRAKNTASQR